jgi:hypothetical protein
MPDMSGWITMSQSPCGEQQTGGGPVTVSVCAEASATEEPDAGILHVRTVRGAPGNRRPYRGGEFYYRLTVLKELDRTMLHS